MKLCTSTPSSLLSAATTSNNVVSTGNVFKILPLLVCRRRRVSVYAEDGLEVTVPEVVGKEGAAG